MGKYVEIVRLWERGVPQRDIAESQRCSLATVSKTVKAARAKGVGSDALEGRDDAAAREVLFGWVERAGVYREPDFERVERLLRRDSVNLSLLWDEYARECRADGVTGYQYSQWCALYAKWRKSRGVPEPRLRVRRVPGRVAEVDWAGSRAEWTDRATGEVRLAWVFVGGLPYSQRLFVEAFGDLGQASWIRAHVDMFRSFGGVTQLVTPDNCKTGVVKPDYYDPQVNPDYARLAAHHGFGIVPARPRAPRDKGSIENTVKFAQTWVVAYLRNQVFFSLEELNQAIRGRVAVLNAQPFQGLGYSRDDVFAAEEAGCLQPLPATTFELATWKTAKVGVDYCVQVERQHYSVPYRLIGRQVDVRVTDTAVEAFDAGERVASHPRLAGRLNQASIAEEHMPHKHRMMSEEWNPDRFARWAASIGPNCATVIESILSSKPHPAQTYRACLGVLAYAKSKGNTYLEELCRQAVAISPNPSYKHIKMLATRPAAPPTVVPEEQCLPGVGATGMVRGAGYYRMGDES
jgi:transposase